VCGTVDRSLNISTSYQCIRCPPDHPDRRRSGAFSAPSDALLRCGSCTGCQKS
jgi:hypothetical protein